MIPDYNTLKDEALSKLRNNWTNPVLGIFLVAIISGSGSFIPGVSVLLGGPFAYGLAVYFLKISRGQTIEIGNIFDGFKVFGKALGAYLLMLLIIIGCTLLLIIPGIIAALALSQTYKIMHDNPELGVTDAMSQSHEMMKGHRGEYFLLNLSFIGWAFLCLLTLGIGFFWLGAYVSTTNSIYYNYLIGNKPTEIESLGSELID